MTKELREKLAALRAIAPELNAAADDANKAVRAVEEVLREVGISARGDCFESEYVSPADDDGENEAPCVSSYLAFGRIRGDYAIHVVDETTVPDHDAQGFEVDKVLDTEQREWSCLSRESRLNAITCLPNLLDVIATRARAQVDRARSATGAAREVLEAVDPLEEIDPLDVLDVLDVLDLEPTKGKAKPKGKKQ